MKSKNWWAIAAIATPVILSITGWLWLFPHRQLQPEGDRLSPNASVTQIRPHRETRSGDLRTVLAVAGGVLLLFNFRLNKRNPETADFYRADLKGADFCGADLKDADFCGADLKDADFCGADLKGADLKYADLKYANLNGCNLSGADLRYADLSDADLRYANLSGADLRYANLSRVHFNCAILSDANFSNANLSGALLFFINSREVLNLEPFQLKAEPSPFLCNVALPAYGQQPPVNPNRDCHRLPQLLSDRYDISLEEAQGIVDEARQHPWD
ncbi:MAG: pentapeptide repeat-containing protein [Jaaginema sp. PMC 1078.18]|nr:pentapeptide repeat-containing protein [Jaaginema sp. PMC 1078.18]